MSTATSHFNKQILDKTFVALTDAVEQLTGLLWTPFEDVLGDAKRIILCPESRLHLLPFEMLFDDGGTRLFERGLLQYVSNAREILRFAWDHQEPASSAVVLADPVFDHPEGDLPEEQPEPEYAEVETYEEEFAFRGVAGAGRMFSSLPHTRQEAAAVRDRIHQCFDEEPMVYLQDEATKEILAGVHRPRALHVATHAFVTERLKWKKIPSLVYESPNPLLLAGLAFAGAGKADREGESLLTALEASQLDLRGTDLVVLSACGTGLGRITSGEGIHGLRRAFLHAGARTVVVSLWDVPDRETREFMEHYYGFLAKGKGKIESLHLARRQMRETARKRYGIDHPLFWAGFVGIGEHERMMSSESEL